MANSDRAGPTRNKCGNIVDIGGFNGHGGDTGMLPRQLFYCGKYQQECRCFGCNGICGPTDGCTCNACVELVGVRVNKSQHLCRKGTVENQSVIIGQANIKVTNVYYCGRMKNECYCGKCDGMCDPTNGCQCFDCLEPIDMKVNQVGHFCKRGPINQVALHLNIPASELFYCGRVKSNFVCRVCIGSICDPANGCPCDDCFKLSETKINRLSDVCHRENYTITGGHTGVPCKDLFYCNKPKNQCHCGSCDGNCGPTNGCPCNDCLELVGLLVLPTRFTMRICKRNKSPDAWRECPCEICRNYEHQIRNSLGRVAIKGDVGGPGGYANVESDKLFYCGIIHNECGCGLCYGRCGPTNGCPCSSCIELYLNEISSSRKNTPANNSLPAGCSSTASTVEATDSSKDDCCVVCLDSRKTVILVPCGHYAFCKKCADEIVTCAICRKKIQKRVIVICITRAECKKM